MRIMGLGDFPPPHKLQKRPLIECSSPPSSPQRPAHACTSIAKTSPTRPWSGELEADTIPTRSPCYTLAANASRPQTQHSLAAVFQRFFDAALLSGVVLLASSGHVALGTPYYSQPLSVVAGVFLACSGSSLSRLGSRLCGRALRLAYGQCREGLTLRLQSCYLRLSAPPARLPRRSNSPSTAGTTRRSQSPTLAQTTLVVHADPHHSSGSTDHSRTLRLPGSHPTLVSVVCAATNKSRVHSAAPSPSKSRPLTASPSLLPSLPSHALAAYLPMPSPSLAAATTAAAPSALSGSRQRSVVRWLDGFFASPAPLAPRFPRCRLRGRLCRAL